MSQDLRADRATGEQLVLPVRSSDPPTAASGYQCWIRSDLDSGDKIATLRWRDGTEVPIFPTTATFGPDVYDWFRVPVGGQMGVVPLAQASDATFDGRRIPWGGTDYGLHDGLELSAIPDTSMFQSPIYQWAAVDGIDVSDGEPTSSWDDALSGLTASATNTPTYQSDQSGFEAVDYQSAEPDHHLFGSDGQLPTGGSPVSFAGTVYVKSGADGALVSYGKNNADESATVLLRTNGDGTGYVRCETWQGSIRAASASNYNEGQWITVGGKISNSDGAVVYINGVNDGNDTSGTLNQQDANRAIGRRVLGSDFNCDMYLHDLVVSSAWESDQAFADYHQDRLG